MFRRTSLIVVALLLLSGLALPAAAQIAPTPIQIGETLTGEVSAANIAPAFVFSAAQGTSIEVTVQATTQGFAPALRVITAGGSLVQDVPNPTGAPLLEQTVTLPANDTYILQVQSANGFGGQFSLALEEGLPAPEPLTLDQQADSAVGAGTAMRRYSFSASDEALELVLSSDDQADVLATLFDEAEEIVALVNLKLTGATLVIPPETGGYILQIERINGDGQETISVLLQVAGAEQDEPTPEPTSAPQQPAFVPQPLPSTGPCVVASLDGTSVNIRTAPTTSADRVAQLSGNNTATVLGRLADGSWYQVTSGGGNGWIASFVVRTGGANCGAVPIVSAPGSAPAGPTATPAPVTGGVVDLVVSGISVNPSTPVDGQEFSIAATVANLQGGTANNILVRLSLDVDGLSLTAPTTEITIPSLAGGGTFVVNFSGLRGDDDGSVDVEVTVDPNNAIGETDEGNNRRTTDFDVVESRADLVVQNMNVSNEDGTNIEVSVTVRNQGTEDSEDFQVRISFDPEVTDSRTIDFDDLNAGESRTQTLTVDVGTTGSLNVRASADANDSTEESNEDNNGGSYSITVD